MYFCGVRGLKQSGKCISADIFPLEATVYDVVNQYIRSCVYINIRMDFAKICREIVYDGKIVKIIPRKDKLVCSKYTSGTKLLATGRVHCVCVRVFLRD